LYQRFGRSCVSRKVVADNGGSIGGIDVDTIMISGPQEGAGVADKYIVLYNTIGPIEKRNAMLCKVPDRVVFDDNVGVIGRVRRHRIVEVVVNAYRVDLIDAYVDGACVGAQDVEPAVPDIVVHDPQVTAVKTIVPKGSFIVQRNSR
jgi:hypothetical protein